MLNEQGSEVMNLHQGSAAALPDPGTTIRRFGPPTAGFRPKADVLGGIGEGLGLTLGRHLNSERKNRHGTSQNKLPYGQIGSGSHAVIIAGALRHAGKFVDVRWGRLFGRLGNVVHVHRERIGVVA